MTETTESTISNHPSSSAGFEQEDGEAETPDGQRVPFSWFRTAHPVQPQYVLVTLPGLGHVKQHYEAPDWIDGLTNAGVDVITLSYDRRRGKELHAQDLVQQMFAVLRTADLRPDQVVLLGHSMGSAVALAAATPEAILQAGFRYEALLFAGLILLGATAPPMMRRDLPRVLLRLALRQPQLTLTASRDPTILFRRPALARELLFQPGTPQETVEACTRLVVPEAMTAAAELLKVPLACPAAQRMLLLTGACDRLAPPQSVYRSARLYQKAGANATFVLLPGASHDMMLERDLIAIRHIISFIQAGARRPIPFTGLRVSPRPQQHER